MLKWLKKNKDAIVIALVAGIVLEIVKGNSLNILDSLLSLGGPIAGFVVDKIYFLSARYSVASMSYVLVDLFITTICSICMSVAIVHIFMDRHKKKEQLDDPTVVECVALDSHGNVLSEHKEGFFRINRLRLFIIFWGLILFMMNMFFYAIPGKNYSLFERNMIAIHPYIEEMEYNQLFSKWVMMKNEADFSVIKQRIEVVKKNNNLGEYKF